MATSAASGPSADLSFLAPPGQLADWRLVLAYEAAASGGVFDALPGSLPEIATGCGLDEGALRAILGQLAAWGLVAVDGAGRYEAGPYAPGWRGDAMLLRHAAVIRRWASLLRTRIRDPRATADEAPVPRLPSEVNLDLLAIHQRRLIDPVLDRCLAHFPDAVRVLDLGGGHGEHSLALARRGLRPTMQDLPSVIEVAQRRGDLPAAGVDLFAGDLHTTVADGPFDLVFCSGVTNMFDAARNRDLYRRLRRVLAPGGGLAIVSYLRGRNQVAAAFALQMLAWTDGGDAHGEDDYRRWLAETGYQPSDVHDFVEPPQTLVLARR